MPYFGVDDGFAFHPKAVHAGNAALGLWVRAGSWCNQQLTDGFIPSSVVAVLGTAAQAARLVRVGLWIEADGGFLFHQWTDEGRNFSRSEVLAKREADRRRKAEARASKSTKSQVTDGGPAGIREESARIPDGVRADSALPIPSHPIPSQEGSSRGGNSPSVDAPPSPHCPRHRDNPTDAPCRGCRDARLEFEAWTPPPKQINPPCGECGPNRMVELPSGALTHCPTCHPLRSVS